MSSSDRAYEAWQKRQRWLEANRDQLIRRRDQLLTLIERDFAKVTREGGVSIREAGAIDDYGTPDECAAARAKDSDTHWSQILLPDLDLSGAALSFFDPIGFRYHIPAYMCFTLRHGYRALGEVVNANCIDSVVYDLRSIGEALSADPPTKPEPFKYAHSRYEMLDIKQRRCCARFLLFDSIATDDDLYIEPNGCHWWMRYLEGRELEEAKRIWPES